MKALNMHVFMYFLHLVPPFTQYIVMAKGLLQWSVVRCDRKASFNISRKSSFNISRAHRKLLEFIIVCVWCVCVDRLN